jgi:transcriptional regulator of NAD metabolism
MMDELEKVEREDAKVLSGEKDQQTLHVLGTTQGVTMQLEF